MQFKTMVRSFFASGAKIVGSTRAFSRAIRVAAIGSKRQSDLLVLTLARSPMAQSKMASRVFSVQSSRSAQGNCSDAHFSFDPRAPSSI